MFARIFCIQEAIKIIWCKLQGIRIFCFYEVRLSKVLHFQFNRSAEFHKIFQIQGIFLIIVSLRVKRVRKLETMPSKILNPSVRNAEPFPSQLNGVRNSQPFPSQLNGVRNSEPFSVPAERGQKFWTFSRPCWMGSEILNPFPSQLKGVRNSEPFLVPVGWGQKFWTLFRSCWTGLEILILFPSQLKGVRNSEPFPVPVEQGQKFWTFFRSCWIGPGWWCERIYSVELILQFSVSSRGSDG